MSRYQRTPKHIRDTVVDLKQRGMTCKGIVGALKSQHNHSLSAATVSRITLGMAVGSNGKATILYLSPNKLHSLQTRHRVSKCYQGKRYLITTKKPRSRRLSQGYLYRELLKARKEIATLRTKA